MHTVATDTESCDRVCNDCKALAIDILSGYTHSNDRWQTIRSEYATLSYAKSHLDGTVATLQRSAGRGCQLCRLIDNKVRELDGSRSASFYHIFVWDKVPEKCQFQIAIGDIRMFIKHVSQWQPPKSLAFFGQFTSMPKLPDLGNVNLSSNGDRPLLSYLPNQFPGSPEAFRQVRQWLAECQNRHPECTRPPSILPKRVLDVGRPGDELKVALYITRGEVQPYLALSYTWGETGRLVTCRNSNDNLPTPYVVKRLPPKRQSGQAKPCVECVPCWSPDDIPLNAFPETLRDAVHITRALEFRYIWIDSLCILQSDDRDWAEQGAAMTDIYGRSTLTISATSTQSNNQNILSELRNDKIGIGTWWNRDASEKPVEIFVGDTMKTLDLEEEFISTRGWVFQERLVSTATLHYTGDGMVWECAHGTCLDHDQNVSSVPWKANWRKIMRQATSDPSNTAFTEALGKNRYDVWYEWISAYSERNLFDSRDKFPAIAGVAKKFAQVFRLTYPAYEAGLWRDDFVAGLLWRRHNRTETLIPLREKFVAPTWSWGSVKGRLEYRSATLVDSKNKGPTLKVRQFNVLEKHPQTYGRLLQGTILVEGLLQPVTVDRQSHPGVRQKPYQECGVSQGFVNNVNVLCMLDEYVQSAPRYYQCWCLRIGSYDLYGREADVFLLLDRVAGSTNEFYRVGFAETDVWWDRLSPTPNSGLFASACLTNLTTLTIK